MTQQKTFVIDLDRCIGCHGCAVACKQENGVALGLYWNKVLTVGPHGTFPKVEMYFFPAICQQCTNPPCVKVCPTGGVLQAHRHRQGEVHWLQAVHESLPLWGALFQ